jgi:hypothetical protein
MSNTNDKTKRYRLKHDLIGFKKGDVFIPENEYTDYYNVNFHNWHERIHKLTIEANPDSFEEIHEPKQSLFTTEDGYPIYEGDIAYTVGELLEVKQIIIPKHRPYYDCNLKFFFTPDAANEYVKQKKEPVRGKCVFDEVMLNERLAELKKDCKWVKSKTNGTLRYVTQKINDEIFEDNGIVSGKPSSPFCHYSNYIDCTRDESIDAWLNYFRRQPLQFSSPKLFTQAELEAAERSGYEKAYNECYGAINEVFKNQKNEAK